MRRGIGMFQNKKVAKLVLIDADENYLLLCRDHHPAFGNDPDLPGGTLEVGESTQETMLREVEEEIGVKMNVNNVKEIYAGTDYSTSGTYYALYVAAVAERPPVTLSWEHSSYEWMPRTAFIEKATNAKDAYMHMVANVVRSAVK